MRIINTHIKIFAAVFLAIMLSGGCKKTADEITVISLNIRQSGLPDFDAENAWPNRKNAVVNMILEEKPDCIGMQELCYDQKEFICSHLPEYSVIGVGRDDGKNAGECMAIYYRTAKFDVLDTATFWLSETPDSVSFGWDAACRRTITMAHLKSQDSGRDFFYFNTHLDHVGPVARKESVVLIDKIVNKFDTKEAPVIIGGDMNSNVTPIFEPLFDDGFKSARDIAPVTDTLYTFNAWGLADNPYGNTEKAYEIDHFFVRGPMEVKSFKTLTDDYGAPYISDHYPVKIVFDIK